MNNTPTPTPETDASRHDLSDYGIPVPCSYGDWVPYNVAERLERELTAVTEQLRETQEALAAEIKHHTAKLMQDELVERCRRMSAVIDAARCIRHWHDREPDGMVVSKSHVFALWQTLNELDKPNARAMTPATESDHGK